MTGTVTFLGSGTSTGVPTLGCNCAVCTSTDARDQRLRPSLWISFAEANVEANVVIDTTPDFRTQALRARIPSLDALLYTHSHADHIMGLDDVRPFNFGRPQPLPAYGNAGTIADIHRVFRYVFDGHPQASAIPRLVTHVIEAPIELHGACFEPLPVLHGSLPVLGYRFGPNAYITDFSTIPPAVMERLHGLDLLVLDALRHRPHPTHSNLANSLRLVAELQPRRAYFTHIAHELGHAATEASLPAGVHLAYDGLRLPVNMMAMS
ncbi:MAG TPA: MBL fold metallo-hydrolase [Terriglobales bacterium]|nr:MBL fold metallo-hydrolase [Terriglobales bacterium]